MLDTLFSVAESAHVLKFLSHGENIENVNPVSGAESCSARGHHISWS